MLAQRAPKARRRALPRRRQGRGFTLLELMVTIILIGILLVMSLPSITGMMRDRRTNQAAQEAAILYRRARATALGRGGAVLVRYATDATSPRGRVEVREALAVGGANQCANSPSTSCLQTSWAPASANNNLIATFDPALLGAYDNVRLDFFRGGAASAESSPADVCFSPLGRAWLSTPSTGGWIQLTEVPSIRAVPIDNFGLTRTILIPPTGITRIAL
jgi:prepilin-type N-terminal cleavage/methylation domain-containing protein